MPLEYEPEKVKPPDEGTHNIAGAMATEFASGAARSLMAPVLDQLSEGTDFATRRLGVPLQGATDYLKDSAQTWRRVGDAIHSTLSEERRQQAEASFVPKEGQPSAWSAPFGTAAMHLAGGLPVMAAVAATKNPYAAAGVGAVQAQAQRLSDVRGQIDNATDDELAQAHPKFAEWTRMGLPSGEARKLLEDELASLGTRAIEAVGGAAGAAPLGHIAGGGVKAATLRGTVGRGALEGGGGMAVQSGLHEVAEQQGQRNTGARQRLDGSDIARATLAGGIEGTAIGGGFAGVHGLPGAVRKRAAEYVQKTSTIAPSPDQQAVLQADQQPGPPPTQPPAGPATGLDAAIAAKEAELAEAAPPAAPPPDGTAPPTKAATEVVEQPAAPPPTAEPLGPISQPVNAPSASPTAAQRRATDYGPVRLPVNPTTSNEYGPANRLGAFTSRPSRARPEVMTEGDLYHVPPVPDTIIRDEAPAVPPAPEALGQALDTAPAHYVPPVPDTIIREDAGAKAEQLSKAMTDTATAPKVEPAKAAPEQTVLPPFNEATVTEHLRKTGSAGTSALARHFGVTMSEAGAMLKSLEGKVISRPDKKGLRRVLGVERAKVDAVTLEGKANELLATQPDAATLVKADTPAEQIASKVAEVTAPKVPTKVSPAAKAARGVGDTVGKDTGRKLVSVIKKAVAPVVQKIAESRAETQAEKERARAEGRPATLKPAPDANKLTEEAADQAVQQFRDADAERQRKARERQRKETDRQARDILEGTWVHKLDSGDARPDGRPTQDALSRFAKRYQSLVDRAQQDRLPVVRDGKIVSERTSKANLESDADEMPHVSFLRDVARWLRRVEDYRNNPHHNKLPPIEKGLIDLITQEGSLANKDFAAAAEARRMRQSADREYRAGDDTIIEKVDQTSMGESPEEAMLRAEREREEADDGVDAYRMRSSRNKRREERQRKHRQYHDFLTRRLEEVQRQHDEATEKEMALINRIHKAEARGDKAEGLRLRQELEKMYNDHEWIDDVYGETLEELNRQDRTGRVEPPRQDPIVGGLGTRAHPEFWDAVRKTTHTVGSLLGSMRGKNLDPHHPFRMAGIMRAVRRAVDDLPVAIVSEEMMTRFMASRFDDDNDIAGVYVSPDRQGFIDGHRGIIVLAESHMHNPNTLLHEAVHAATVVAINHFPEMHRLANRLFEYVKQHADPRDLHAYGFTNAKEFVAEGMSDPAFQAVLNGIAVPKHMLLGLKVRTMWHAFVDMVARAIGLPREHVSALNAVMKLFDDASEATSKDLKGWQPTKVTVDPLRAPTRADAVEYWRDKVGTSNEWKLRTQRAMDKLATLTQLGNTSDALFGPNKPARRLVEALAKVHNERERIQEKDAELLRRTFDAQRRYGAETFREFSSILNDETSSGLFLDKSIGDQKGLSTSEEWRAEVNHAAMKERWDRLVAKAPELAELRTELHQMFRERQREMSLQLINNQLRALSEDGQGSPALAQRILDNKMSNADKAVLGDNLPRIKEAAALVVKSGPYVPLMRHGDFVVQGRYKIDAPADARRLNGDGADDPAGNIFEFKTAEAAKAFVQNQVSDLHSEVKSVYVDPETGSTKGVDEDGKEVRITKDDTNSEKRWRVEVQDRHVEFFERQRHAEVRRNELANDKRITDVADVDIRRLNAADLNLSFMPAQLQRLAQNMQKRNSFKEMPAAAQREVMRQLLDTSIAAMGTTRAQTRRLPRTNVKGAADDIARALQGYSTSTANYLGRLKHQPEADAILKEMTKYVDETPHEKGPHGAFDDMRVLRRQRLQEFERRLYSGGEYTPTNWFSAAASRVLQMSYLDKLASPAYHVINSMEPWTVSLPVLAAKHGAMATVRAMHEAYSAIGAARVLGAGAKDTAKAFRQDAGFTDYAKTFKERVAGAPDGAELVAMFDKLIETGLLSRNAGQELTRATFENTSRVGRALDRADLMARQFGTAVEGVNRAVTSIAAYRLARRRGMSEEAARAHAVEAVHDTMGNYNAWNAAPMFNHPLGRLALQFRKYAQKTYYLLGKQVAGMKRGDPEAYKAFAGLMATHFMIAGTLGLPLEPLRAAMLAAGLLGITDAKYDDLEQNVRRGASAVFGKLGGEIFARGPARLLGIDLASRMGLDGLVMQPIDPKTMKKDDLYAYFAKSFAGAPADFILDASQGFQALGRGDVDEALRLLVPLKIFADSIQAYQMTTQGKQSAGGREQARQWTALEGATKVLGFTPATVAEEQEQSFAIRGDQKVLRDQRQKLIGDWIKAQPADRDYQWQAILQWNKGQPKNAWVSRQDVLGALQRKLTEERSGTYAKGVRYSARDKHLQEQNSFYNVQ